MLRKTNDKIERDDQKIEKSDRKDEKHDWRKHLNKDNDQTIDDHDFSVFFARNQRSLKTKIKQKDKIDDINQKRIRDETSVKNECSKNDRFDM